MDDHELLLSIQELLDGVEWAPDTLDCIASLMIQSGYRIRDVDDVDLTAADLGRAGLLC